MSHQGAIPDGRDDFGLIETLLWTRTAGFYLLDDHVARLRQSAAALGFRCSEAAVRAALARAVDAQPEETLRVRLTLARDGAATAAPSRSPCLRPMRAGVSPIASVRFDSKDPLLGTRRRAEGSWRKRSPRRTCASARTRPSSSTRGTSSAKGSRSNLFVAQDGILLTPPVASGLLPGTLRGRLISGGSAREKVLLPPDLERAELYMGNSVRGLVRAILVGEARTAASPFSRWAR